jgi:hypothetical protein
MLNLLGRHPSAILLIVQLFSIMLYPFMENTGTGRALFGVFGIGVASLAVWVVNRSPVINWISWALAIPAVALSLYASFAGHAAWLPVAHLLEASLYFYTAYGLIVYMLSDQHVTVDELFAVGATFTLLAWGFAFAYLVCQQWYPGSFTAIVNNASPRTWVEMLFFSFSILSGTGLGDIVPVTPQARALVMIEMFSGVMYLALIVSRLVGLVARNNPR